MTADPAPELEDVETGKKETRSDALPRIGMIVPSVLLGAPKPI